MSSRYTPLPTVNSSPDADRELEDAFESDNDDEDQTTHSLLPHHQHHHRDSRAEITTAVPGAYDFEREYDYPPPGSPPRPSARALPNDIGNSNGYIPTSPISIPVPHRSIFRRAVGAILPTHYAQLPTEAPSTRSRGGGVENDGVFANVMAKPQVARTLQTEDGNVHVVPEDNSKDSPPSYVDAQADAVPPYWETTIHAPAAEDPNGDMIIEDLPTGSFFIFMLNLFISFFFQFIGFFLTYLLHTSHASKFGSRAGLGLTLIQYGLYSRTASTSDTSSGDNNSVWTSSEANAPRTVGSASVPPDPADYEVFSGVTSRDWLAFLFMTLGWFLFISSFLGFWRVKRWEHSIRANNSTPRTAEDVERDIAVRRNLESVFGIPFESRQTRPAEEAPNPRLIAQEARLQRDLRAAGLL